MNRFVNIKIQPGLCVAVRIRFRAVIDTSISDLLSNRTARWVRTYLLYGQMKCPLSIAAARDAARALPSS